MPALPSPAHAFEPLSLGEGASLPEPRLSTIRLEGMTFHGYHGVLAGEREVGNRYTVELELTLDLSPEAYAKDGLSGTVDYGQVYQVVAARMARRANLLEHLAYTVAADIRARFAHVRQARVSVAKHNPPIGGTCDLAMVTITL